MVSDINEYEILQLLAGEARTLLGRYKGGHGLMSNTPALIDISCFLHAASPMALHSI